jgi:hypothetical protein
MNHAIPIDLWQSPWVHREFVTSDEPSMCLDGVPYTMATLLLAALRDLWMPGHRCLIVDLGHDMLPELRTFMASIGVVAVSECAWQVEDGGLLWLVGNKNAASAYDTNWDCIVVDEVDEFGSYELTRLVRHLRPNGRLRTARGTSHTEALLGRKIRGLGTEGASVTEELRLRNIAFAASISYHRKVRWDLMSSTTRTQNIVEAIGFLRDANDHGIRWLGSAEEFAQYVRAFSDGFSVADEGPSTFVLITCDSKGCAESVDAQVHEGGGGLASVLNGMRDHGWDIENATMLGEGLMLCPGCAARQQGGTVASGTDSNSAEAGQ